jgi:two-component system chemotaxis response regulator CheB
VASTRDDRAASLIDEDIEAQKRGDRAGEPSLYSCPDCGGVLWQLQDEPYVRFRCHTGHECSGDELVVAKSRALEQAVMEAVRVLKEKAMLLRQLAVQLDPQSMTTAEVVEQAEQDDEHARLLQSHLLAKSDAPSSIDITEILATRIVREMRRPPDD